jgi:uncharacterized membrane protein HdeD (DUF308 family)
MVVATRKEAFMFDVLTRHWWLLPLRGLIAIVFGALCFAMPGMALTTLVLLFGAYAFADGVIMIAAAVRSWNHREDRWLVLLMGLLGVGAGVVTVLAPGITALGLLAYIAAWVLTTGVLQIVAAVRLRKEITGEIWLVLSGLASIAFALALLWQPLAGALSLLWLIGAFSVVGGALMIALGIEVRGLAHGGHKHAASAA